MAAYIYIYIYIVFKVDANREAYMDHLFFFATHHVSLRCMYMFMERIRAISPTEITQEGQYRSAYRAGLGHVWNSLSDKATLLIT